MPRRLDASSPPYVAYVALACSVFRAYVRRSGVHVPACGRLVFLVSFWLLLSVIVWSGLGFSFCLLFFSFYLFGCLVFVLLLLSLFLVRQELCLSVMSCWLCRSVFCLAGLLLVLFFALFVSCWSFCRLLFSLFLSLSLSLFFLLSCASLRPLPLCIRVQS